MQDVDIYYYDLNSSYPAAMRGVMPFLYQGSSDYQNDEPIIEHYLYEVEGCWDSSVTMPIFCDPKTGDPVIDSTLLYFHKFKRQLRWGIELKYPLFHGLFTQLRIYRKHLYLAKNPFTKFVDDLYRMR